MATKATPKKAATRKGNIAPRKAAAKPTPRKSVTKPVDAVKGTFLELVSESTGEVVRIPLTSDMLETVLNTVARDASARINKAATNITEAAYGNPTAAPANTPTRTSALLSRNSDLQDQLATTSYLINSLVSISNRFFGESNGIVEPPALTSKDDSIIGQYDELLKYLRVYNSTLSDTMERLQNFI